MATPSVEEVRAWVGRIMIDRDAKQLGEITDIYLDRETDRPEWAVVRTGLFGLRSSFVPLAEAIRVEHGIQVPHPRRLVKDAPNIEADGQLSEPEEAELYRHYGLDYDSVAADSDQPADQGDGPAADDQPPAPPSGANQPAGTPTPAQGERRIDGEPPVADGPGSSWPAGQENFAVGEGVSRPFVYDTPGPPQDRPGSRQRQPGQVRLRRYLVTEVVTETEAGQQHELRVEQEPVSDQDVDAMTATPGQPEASAQPGPPTPANNDWFRPEGDASR